METITLAASKQDRRQAGAQTARRPGVRMHKEFYT